MMTMKELADGIGVSVATVSHVVNKTRYVSPELRRKVEEAINSLDEVPNFVLKGQKKISETTKRIVVYISDFNDLFQKMVLEELQSLSSLDDEVDLYCIEYKDLDAKSSEVIQLFQGKIAAQVVLFEGKKIPTLKVKFKKIPTVFICRETIETDEHSTIVSQTYEGSYLATNHLIKNGHNKIAFIDFFNLAKSDLLAGYEQALKDNDLVSDENYISKKAFSEKELREYLKKMMHLSQPPTALIVGSKTLLHVTEFLVRQDIRCPEDISIIVTNDEKWYEYFSPSLSAIEHDVKKICFNALNYLKQDMGEIYHLSVPTKLKIRSSTGGIGYGPFGEKAASISSLELTEEEVALVSEKQHTAVISFHYTGASWMDLYEKGIRQVFKNLNIALISVSDAHFNPQLQNKQLNSLLDFEPDIFIAIPTDNKKNSEMFKKIAESSSKLILISQVPEGLTPSDYCTVVSVNEYFYGRLTAGGLGDDLRMLNKKNIGFIYHKHDFYATNQRDKAAKQILLEEYSDLSIVAECPFTEISNVYERTLELLEQHPEIEGLYVCWDKPAIEVLRALKRANREDIIVGTADLDYELAMNMAWNGSIKSISAQQPYEQGRAIGLAAAKAMIGKEVSSFIGVEPLKVTKKNLITSWRQIFREEPSQELIEALKKSNGIG